MKIIWEIVSEVSVFHSSLLKCTHSLVRTYRKFKRKVAAASTQNPSGYFLEFWEKTFIWGSSIWDFLLTSYSFHVIILPTHNIILCKQAWEFWGGATLIFWQILKYACKIPSIWQTHLALLIGTVDIIWKVHRILKINFYGF